MTHTPVTEVIIIGGSAAGLSAALMLGRARRQVTVIDHGLPRNRFAAHMHGVPGFEGAEPAQFRARLHSELQPYGTRIIDGEVIDVSGGLNHLSVHLADETVLRAQVLILATGVCDDLPAIEGIEPLWGDTVLHCPYCHGYEVEGRRLGVIATSAMGLHQAQLLTQWTDQLTFFSAGAGPIDPIIETQLRSRAVQIVTEPVEALESEAAPGSKRSLTAVKTRDGARHHMDAVFTAATLRPLDAMVAALGLERADTPVGSFIKVDVGGLTSHPRILAAGNVVNPMANVPVAVGEGSMAGAMANMVLVNLRLTAFAHQPSI